MPTKRITQIFKELTFDKKLVGIGSVLMLISLFLPWYQDLDNFKTGDMFLGITGPLYFIGFSLLLLAVFNLVLMVMDSTGRKIPHMPVKSSQFYIFTGIFAIYALIAINTIYFHQKFGINITIKQSQFGMFAAFVASALITVGGYLALVDKGAILKEFRDKSEESFIEVPEQEIRRPKENLRKSTDEHVKEENPAEQIRLADVMDAPEVTPAMDVMPTAEPEAVRVVPKVAVAPESINPNQNKQEEHNSSNQTFRMDL